MTKPTVKEHADKAAERIARGENRREVYVAIVRENDLTLGECAALRQAIDDAVISRLIRLQSVADSIRL